MFEDSSVIDEVIQKAVQKWIEKRSGKSTNNMSIHAEDAIMPSSTSSIKIIS